MSTTADEDSGSDEGHGSDEVIADWGRYADIAAREAGVHVVDGADAGRPGQQPAQVAFSSGRMPQWRSRRSMHCRAPRRSSHAAASDLSRRRTFKAQATFSSAVVSFAMIETFAMAANPTARRRPRRPYTGPTGPAPKTVAQGTRFGANTSGGLPRVGPDGPRRRPPGPDLDPGGMERLDHLLEFSDSAAC